jgi:hypothetical protein
MMIERAAEIDRSEAPNRRRVALHESGHAVVARCFDMPLGGCTIVAGENYSGMCWGPNGKPSKLGGSDEICTQAQALMPPLGESRSDAAEMLAYAHSRVIEIVAGSESERLFCADAPPLEALQDQQDAEQFARLMCVHPDAIDTFLAYCRREAALLLNAHASVVHALAEALLEAQTLTGAQIDIVIANALVLEDLAAEKSRSLDWAQRMINARAFEVYTKEDEPDG